ncbi:MAG: CheR family methyltransferase [Gemmatimonadota bacterium]
MTPDPAAALDEDAFAALTAKIAAERPFACPQYKDACLRRRIAVRMRASGVHDYAAYAEVLDRVPGEWERLLDALTINVTRLFRNREAWESVERDVWPALYAAEGPVTAWSAGCSSGDEPVTIAVSALEWAGAHGADPTRLLVHATDIDARALALARAATCGPAAFTETPSARRARWFGGPDAGTARPEVTARLRIARRDLLLEAPPASGLGLIACRNVLIYVAREAQEAVLERFHRALAPGGFLLLGKVESLVGPARARVDVVDARERLFRRAA